MSGRGVGMDVVRRNVESLRGEISIHSVEGLGTTIGIRIPMTLAIINGFRFAVGEEVFVLPAEQVAECLEYTPGDHQDSGTARRVEPARQGGPLLPGPGSLLRARPASSQTGRVDRAPAIGADRGGGGPPAGREPDRRKAARTPGHTRRAGFRLDAAGLRRRGARARRRRDVACRTGLRFFVAASGPIGPTLRASLKTGKRGNV